MDFDLNDIEKLAKLVRENDLNELTFENEGVLLSFKRDLYQHKAVQNQSYSTVTSQVIPSGATNKEEKNIQHKIEHKGKAVISPMVGTFYSAPSPEDEPFIKVGDDISVGQIVCIIEAMKLMNEIEADVSGKITEICVENGQSVDFGQVLMYVD